jgi:hypothetical protein
VFQRGHLFRTSLVSVGMTLAFGLLGPQPNVYAQNFGKAYNGQPQVKAVEEEKKDAEYHSRATYLNKLRASHLGHHDPRLIEALKTLGERIDSLGVFHSSIALYSECLALEEYAYGKDSFDLIPILDRIAYASENAGSLKAAKQYYLRLLTLHARRDGANSYNCGIMCGRLALVSMKLGEFDWAESYLKRQLVCAKNDSYPYSPAMQTAYEDLEKFYEDRGYYTKAALVYLGHYDNDCLAYGQEASAKHLLKATKLLAVQQQHPTSAWEQTIKFGFDSVGNQFKRMWFK